MEEMIEKFIPQFTFRRKYRLWSTVRYKQFLSFMSGKVEQSVDKETKLLSLSLENEWKDQGGNTHVSVRGKVIRRNEKADIGAEVVWLKRRKSFRGNFWSRLNPKTDSELFSEAKSYFHSGGYTEFLALAKYIESVYSSNRVFNKMVSIAERRV